MNPIMLRRTLKDLRGTTLWFAIGSAIYVLALVAFFPSIRDSAAEFEELLDAYPKALREAFRMGDFTTFAGFIAVEVLSIVWPLIAAGLAITSGSAAVAGEIDRGTVDLWLSVPVARWRLLLSKVVAALLDLALLVTVTVIAIAVGAVLVDDWPGLTPLLATFATLLGLSVVILGYSVVVSSLTSRRGLASGLAAAITLLSYLFWILANASDSVTWLRYLSIFGAYDAQAALADSRVNWEGLGILTLVGVICVVAALAIFDRRDAIA